MLIYRKDFSEAEIAAELASLTDYVDRHPHSMLHLTREGAISSLLFRSRMDAVVASARGGCHAAVAR